VSPLARRRMIRTSRHEPLGANCPAFDGPDGLLHKARIVVYAVSRSGGSCVGCFWRLLCAAPGALVLAPARNDSPYVRDDIRIPVAEGHYSLRSPSFGREAPDRSARSFSTTASAKTRAIASWNRRRSSSRRRAPSCRAAMPCHAVAPAVRRNGGRILQRTRANAAVPTTGAASAPPRGTCWRPTSSPASCATWTRENDPRRAIRGRRWPRSTPPRSSPRASSRCSPSRRGAAGIPRSIPAYPAPPRPGGAFSGPRQLASVSRS
jgi:hypothetical protein